MFSRSRHIADIVLAEIMDPRLMQGTNLGMEVTDGRRSRRGIDKENTVEPALALVALQRAANLVISIAARSSFGWRMVEELDVRTRTNQDKGFGSRSNDHATARSAFLAALFYPPY
jgi:hypothetical protein